jgi:preprotein translocase subunit SecD
LGKAFFIIFASYFTLIAAMIPLIFAGAGLLRGFAITTIVGVTAGVLVTRPAFAAIIEILLKKDDDD